MLGDMVYRSSPSFWIYLALVALAVLLSCKYVGRDAVNLTPIVLSFIFVFIFQLAQYPSLAHHDYFYHGILVEVLQSEGRIVSSAGYSAYPGSFVLLSAICVLTGIKPVESEILLVSLLTLLVPTMLLLIGRAILKRYGWLVPWVFLVVGQLFFFFREFSPQFPGLALYLLCVYATVKCYKGRSRTWSVIFILTVTGLVITHPFSSLFIISGLLALSVFENRKLRRVGAVQHLFMLSLVLFFSWSVYVAYEYVYYGSRSLLEALSLTFLLNIAERLQPQQIAPGIVGTVLRFYRWGVLGLFYSTALVAAVKLKDREDVRFFVFIALGVLAGVLALSLASPVIAVERGWLFSYFPVSALASVFLITWLLPKISTRPWKVLAGLLRNGDVIRAVLLMMVFTSFVAANQTVSMTSLFVHQGEITAARFAFQHLETTPSTSQGEFGIYAYYKGQPVTDNEYWSYPAQSWQNATNEAERLLSGEFSLQNSVYQQTEFGFGFVGTNRSLVFNDGLNRLYMADY
jgi:hypothetical protein